MAYNVKKLHALENALRTTAELVGEKATLSNQDGVKVGLDLTNEALICTNAAESINEGIFKVIVMGTYATGKSTIVNALIGSRVLSDATMSSIDVLSFIRYGQDGDNVTVYFSDGTTEVLSYSDFQEKFKYTNEDAEEARRTGEVKRFSNVDFSVIHSNMELLRNGVQIVDSPGIEDKLFAEKTLKLANTANAIIYTTTASAGGFNQNDQEFFNSNFEGRSLNNVFFIINKADLLEEAELDQVKKYHKTQLEYVFKNGEGVFDEQLYTKRVFYVSARFMLEQKTGQYSETYEDTYNPEFERFEKELEEFLTTDARSIATFNSCFTKIANAYKASIHTADMNKSICENGVDSVKDELAIVEQKLKQMEGELSDLRKSFDVAKTKTERVIQSQLNSLVGKIDETWDTEMTDIIESAGFSITDLLSIAWQTVRYFNNEERRNAAFEQKIKPITDGVEAFVRRKSEESLSDIGVLTQPILDDLTTEIKSKEASLNKPFEEIYSTFNVEGGSSVEKGKVNPIKLLVSGLNNDINVMVEVLAGNNMGWMEFLKRTVTEMFIDSILFGVIGGPIGLALFMLKEWWALKKGRTGLVTSIARQTKDQLIAKLQLKINGDESEEIYAKIRKNFDLAYSNISGDVKSKITDERQLLAETQKKLDDASFNYEAEIKRCDYITQTIWETARNAYKSVFEKTIALDEFTQLSVQ